MSKLSNLEKIYLVLLQNEIRGNKMAKKCDSCGKFHLGKCKGK